MRSILAFAVTAILLGIAVPRLYTTHAPAAAPPPQAAPEELAAATYARTVTLRRSDNGHFSTDAVIDGRRLNFMVDTGASVIALREGDAARLGIHPAAHDYTAQVATANGTVRAARIDLDRVEIGDIVVRDVAALVLPDEALSQNLLGMSFLSRLRWEQRNGRLVLEQ